MDPVYGGSELRCGVCAHCPPGVDPSMFDLLAQPDEGRLLLAGEHTDGERTGYADGAYTSGLRTAGMLAVGWTSKPQEA
jgi:polyamine oxidase